MSDAGSLCIVGMGARTPVGLTAAASAAAIRAGISRIAEHPYMVDKAGNPYMVAMDRTLDAHERSERLFVLASSAIDEAIAEARFAPNEALPVFLALPEEGRFFTRGDMSTLMARIQAHLDARCRVQVQGLPRGNAAGILGLQQAAQVLRARGSQAALVVGVDSHLDSDFLEALDDAGRLMSVTNRWGYPPGEGAGALLIARGSTAGRLGLAKLSEIASLGTADEPNRIATDSVCVGVGLAKALRDALDADSKPKEPVDAIYCDINGERYRSSEYVYAALRLNQYLPEPTLYAAPVDGWGDVGAATSTLLTCLAIGAGQRGYAAGPKALVWASSESGLRGAAVYRIPIAESSL